MNQNEILEITARMKGMISLLSLAVEMIETDNFCLSKLYQQAKESLTPEDREIFERHVK